MEQAIELKAGDKCPTCDGDLRIDKRQAPEAVIERHRAVMASPAAHEAYRREVQRKAKEDGVIHTCAGCGYQARMKVDTSNGAGAAASRDAQASQ